MASTTTTSATNQGGATAISTVNDDVIENHILTRLDGVTLTSLSCTSSYFHSLSSQEELWRDICISTWPSINHPRVLQLISAFPNGRRSCVDKRGPFSHIKTTNFLKHPYFFSVGPRLHKKLCIGYRNFFSDSFPLLTAHNQPRNVNRPSLPTELISTVDIWYHKEAIFSRVLETDTWSGWFQHSPFRVELLDPKEVVPTPVKIVKWDDDTWQRDLEENLTLSWVIIDPTRKRAANFSSLKPVLVQRHWLSGEVQAEYATVLGCDRAGLVECKVVVTCVGREQGELHVREAYMQVEDMDGKCLSGKGSLGILVNAMEFGKRRRREKEEGRKRHGEYLEKKRWRREKGVLRERMLDMACVACVVISLAFAFISYWNT